MDLESEIDIFYDCDECDKTFPSVLKLRDHTKKVHIKPYSCKFCHHRFGNTSNRKQHILNQHTERKPTLHPCEHCKQIFERKSNLSEHLRMFHPDAKLHLCDICNKTFFSEIGLKCHRRLAHSELKINCPECKLTFKHEKSLEKHFDKEHLQLGKESHTYKCDDCGKTLITGCLFHVCKNEVPLTCDECGETLPNTAEFKEHKKTSHTPRKYQCTECEKVYLILDKLERHIRYIHPEVYATMQEAKMELENQSHKSNEATNVKKHKCGFCEVAFARPENLKRHLHRMHRDIKVKAEPT